MIKKRVQQNKGYTLLFAVLVSSVVLAVGISILTISKKEFLLASSARESTSAFYAADSGLECAIYNVDLPDNFSTTTQTATVNCMGYTMPPLALTATGGFYYIADGNEGTFIFHIRMGIPTNKSCAIVSIHKYYRDDDDGSGLTLHTTIESRGYNLGWNGTTCSLASPRRVERALRYTF